MSDEYLKNPDFTGLGANDRTRLNRMLRGGATRRDMLGFMGAAGASALFAGSVLGSATQAYAETPKRGGRLILADDASGPEDTLDPILATSSIDYVRLRQFYGSLTRLNAKLQVDPELAVEFMPNADATEWTFRLREGVEFHDGQTMTADDVIYSMNRHMGPNTLSKAAALVADIDRWEKVGPYEVRAFMKSPNADLPIVLGTFHFKIVKDGTTDFTTPVGTGPFEAVEFQPGIRSVGRRFENYWGDGPYLDEIETIGIADADSRLNALIAGDVDAIVEVPPKSIDMLGADGGINLWTVNTASYPNIVSRLDVAGTGNQDLILAMKHLMDRERIVKGVLKGQGSLGNDQPIGSAYADHCADLPQRTLDPEKAKFHFERSGYGSTPIPIAAAELTAGAVEQVLILQREAAKIGMNIEVQKVSTDGYYGSVWLKAPVCVGFWNMRPTANAMLSLAYASTAPWNESRFVNEQFDQTLYAVRAVTDAQKRSQMYCDLQTMIHEDAGTIIGAHKNAVDAVRSHVRGMTYVPLNSFGGAEAAEFLWRDDV